MPYGNFQNLKRPKNAPEASQYFGEHPAVPLLTNIRIYTIIEDTWTNVPGTTGIKSQHDIVIDWTHLSLKSEWDTGRTFGVFGSVRDNFEVRNETIRNDGYFVLNAIGETASVFVPANINYDLTIEVDYAKRRFSISGWHDGYPSYSVYIHDNNGLEKKLYYFHQGYTGELAGSGDVKVKEAGGI